MITKWTSHLFDQKDKDKFSQEVLGSRRVLERLTGIIREMETDLNRVEMNPKTYDIPNWDYRQAHNNGYRQALSIFEKVLDLDQKISKDNQ